LGVTVETDYRRALARQPAAVLICGPTHFHAPLAIEALDVGAYLFIEKPLAVTLEDADRIIATARDMHRDCLVGCNMRFHPGVAAIHKAVTTGAIGKPWSYRAYFGEYLEDWRPGRDYRQTYSAREAEGGGIITEGVHEIDYLRWMGGEATEVRAMRAKVSDLEIDAEDVAEISMRLQSGALAQIHLDYLRRSKWRGCEVMGSDGVIAWGSEGKPPSERVEVRRYAARNKTWTTDVLIEHYNGNDMYLDEMRHFLDCVNGAAYPMLDLQGARRVLEIALLARNADAKGIHEQ
jgi:predicted dehydrogenase